MSLRTELDEDKKQLAILQAKIVAQETAMRAVQSKLNILDAIESQLAILEASSNPEQAAQIEPIRLNMLSELSQIVRILMPT